MNGNKQYIKFTNVWKKIVANKRATADFPEKIEKC